MNEGCPQTHNLARRFLASCSAALALTLVLNIGGPGSAFAQDSAIAAQATVPVVTRGPFLQIARPTGMVIRWSTNVACNSFIRIGTDPGALTRTVRTSARVTQHSISVTGLEPDTLYYYETGYAGGGTIHSLTTGPEYTFYTPPLAGTPQPIRIWAIGDAGTGTPDQAAVRDAYAAYTGTQYTDLWLMLGDNAYEAGTDPEYQAHVFNVYPAILRQSPLWPAVGNHDTAQSTRPPLNIPYFRDFSLPTRGQAGGRPSGTEKYYSFNYANVHFVCLDSQTSGRLSDQRMARWLRADLKANQQLWTVAYWHHPPYSKGSHDSNVDPACSEMRSNIVPILEQGGVDLVLSGHSHAYERSYFIDGHYGTSNTFTESMKRSPGNGQEDGDGAYVKPAARTPHAGTVYIVEGSSGKLGRWISGSTDLVNPTPHPAMLTSLRALGSLVIDVNGPRMDVKFLRETGAIDDHFTILKPADAVK